MTATVCSTKATQKSLGFNALCVLGGSAFLAVMAQVAIPLPFTIVPLTLQTLGVLMVGGLLGSKRGAGAVLAYIAQGAIGLPVFAGGGAGLTVLMGPKGGYYLGFVLAAFLIGLFVEKKKGRGWNIPAFLAAEFVILSVGSLWLSLFVGGKTAWMMGFAPFIFCGITKSLIAACATKIGFKLFK